MKTSPPLRALLVAEKLSNPLFAQLKSDAFLLPIGDSCSLIMAINELINAQVTEIHIAAEDSPQLIEDMLAREYAHKVKIKVHWVRAGTPPIQIWRRLPPLPNASWVILANATRVPLLPPLKRQACSWVRQGDRPTGWAVLRSDWVSSWAKEAKPIDIESYLRGFAQFGKVKKILAEKIIDASTAKNLLLANKRFTDEQWGGNRITWRRHRESVYIGRQCRIARTARVIAPVALGPNCVVQAGAVIGPNVVVNSHCVIESNTEITDSVVLPYTQVGQEQTLRNRILRGNMVIDVENKTHYRLPRNRMISAQDFASKSNVARLERFIALLLFLIGWPLSKLAFAIRRPFKNDFVRLALTYGWYPLGDKSYFNSYQRTMYYRTRGLINRGFFWEVLGRFVPALPLVIQGKIGLVGVQPRSAEQWETLPKIWADVLTHRIPGLIAEPSGGNSTLDGLLPEVVASERTGFYERMQLVFWYLTGGYRNVAPPEVSFDFRESIHQHHHRTDSGANFDSISSGEFE